MLGVLAGLALVGFGWSIPSQFKSVPVSVLVEAGRSGPGLEDLMRDALDEGRPGVADLLADGAAAVQHGAAEIMREAVDRYLEHNPDLAIWGAGDPYLTHAFRPEFIATRDPRAGVIKHFLPAEARRSLRGFLEGSRNATVQTLLATADLQSYRQFLPVVSASGAPLEATILLAAMLVQSDRLGDGALRELRAKAERAVSTGDAAELELFYLDLLSLARRLNWGQLTEITSRADSTEALGELRHLLQVAPDAAPVLLASAAIAEQLDDLTGYVIDKGPIGKEAVAFALFHGKGSLDLLLRQQVPVDGDLTLPPSPVEITVVQSALDPIVRFALAEPIQAFAVKIAAYLLGGLLFFLVAEHLTALHRLELSAGFTTVARSVGAMLVCLLLIVFNEPYLAFGSEPSGYELRVVVPVIGTSSVATMTESSNAFPVDVATVVSISFFFMLQSLVYLICLLKLKEIQSKNIPPLLKLRLTENEENLFDSGLYVGIAGTSAALVLQVLGVIEANLLAAYSSNLFGILCVAFVKIRHVRPFRQKLILEMAESGQLAETLETRPVKTG
ncbi:MAG: hypothetical protein D6781_08490 [Verrucomicrobia bacterium]|nr:MAG: hypothetical protein D6781_08490 [Verrucomicrobiota bacterium]